MKFKKMLAAVTATLVITGGAVPGVYSPLKEYSAVAAEETTVYSGSCGENVTWSFDTETGTMTIAGTGKMYDYFDFKPWYFDFETGETLLGGSSAIKSVVVEDGVTHIGDFVFYCNENLTSVTLPDGISVGLYSFRGTPWLSENAVEENGLYIVNDILFDGYSCEGDVVIPDNVKSIAGGAFTIGGMGGRMGTDKITSVTLPDGLKSIGAQAFYECTNLTSVNIPNSVTSIDDSFIECPNLLFRVDENNQYYSSDEYGVLFNKDKTVLINYPKDSKQASYTIPDSVTSIGFNTFAFCTNLTSITIPDSVTIIYNEAFNFCPKLTSVTIPDSVTEIRQWAFRKCKSLESITFLNPECIIDDDPETICNDDVYPDCPYSGVIKGYNNSTAEKYAKKYNRTFESLGDPPTTTTSTAKPTTTSTTTTTTSTTSTITSTTSTTTSTTSTTTTTTSTTTSTTSTTTSTTTTKPTTTSTTTTTSTASTTSETTTSTTTAEPVITTTVSHIASDADLCSWAVNDYQSKTGVTASNAELTVGADGTYVIALSDESGNLLDTYTIDPETGIGTDSAHAEVNLPQTGNNSMKNWLMILGAFLMVGFGLFAVKSSGIIRRKKDEQ